MLRAINLAVGVIPAILLSATIWPFLYRLLSDVGCKVVNYRENTVVNCAGLLIPIALSGTSLLYALILPEYALAVAPALIMVLGASFFGVIDDLLGSGGSKGFRGHFGSLLEGRPTTGVLKAFGVGVLALYVAGMRSTGLLLALDALLIALSVNLMNLMDLRPGRALKVFIAAAAFLSLASASLFSASQAVALGAAAVLLRPDIKERAMLGDVGSNALGAVIGTGFVFNFNWPVRLAVLLLLIMVQIYAERYSITELIERVAILRRFDEWGRAKQGTRNSKRV
ncbi:MAG: hypothetical protein M1548_09915 [Actinobacteria bacterium]|nr:hypothetical protein [Actinomycetota bacterium]